MRDGANEYFRFVRGPSDRSTENRRGGKRQWEWRPRKAPAHLQRKGATRARQVSGSQLAGPRDTVRPDRAGGGRREGPVSGVMTSHHTVRSDALH